jgi:hypothetical protein
MSSAAWTSSLTSGFFRGCGQADASAFDRRAPPDVVLTLQGTPGQPGTGIPADRRVELYFDVGGIGALVRAHTDQPTARVHPRSNAVRCQRSMSGHKALTRVDIFR